MSEELKRSYRGAGALLAGCLAAALCALLVLAGGAEAAATGAFAQMASSPVPVTSVTADPTSGLIYAQENHGTMFFSYDPRTNEWTELPAAPLSSGEGGGAAYLNGKIYTSYADEAANLGVYDIASESWSTIPNPLAAGTGDIAAAGEDLYMSLGTSFVAYDPTTEVTTPLADPPFVFSPWGALQTYNGKIYGDAGSYEQQFGAYDIATNTWEELPELPDGPILGAAIDPVSGTYYAYGDYEENNFYSYDIATEEWSQSKFPVGDLSAGGMAYVSTPGLSGVYVTAGDESAGFYLYSADVADASIAMGVSAGAGSSPGSADVTYTIDVSNGGPAAAAKTTVSDTLPTVLTVLSAASTDGSCTTTAATVSCTLGTLAAGASATITIKATTAVDESFVNSAALSTETLNAVTAKTRASVSTSLLIAPTPTPTPTPEPAPPAGTTTHCVVPKVQGLSLAAVQEALSAAHCALGTVNYEHSALGKGLAISSNPYEGAVLTAASKVDVRLSLGVRPTRCMVPRKLHGMSLKRAKQALRAAHCRPGKIVREHNRRVKRGDVIAVYPRHGRARPAGAKVAIWVSNGRARRRRR